MHITEAKPDLTAPRYDNRYGVNVAAARFVAYIGPNQEEPMGFWSGTEPFSFEAAVRDELEHECGMDPDEAAEIPVWIAPVTVVPADVFGKGIELSDGHVYRAEPDGDAVGCRFKVYREAKTRWVLAGRVTAYTAEGVEVVSAVEETFVHN